MSVQRAKTYYSDPVAASPYGYGGYSSYPTYGAPVTPPDHAPQPKRPQPSRKALSHVIPPGFYHAQLVRSSFRKHLAKIELVMHCVFALFLGLALLQALRSVTTIAMKTHLIYQKRPMVEATRDGVKAEYQQYKTDISRYKTDSGIEELARNHLNYVGKNEVLVRLY